MPTPEQLEAMGVDEASARGIQSLVLLSKENSPEEQRAVKAMIDATSGEYAAVNRPTMEAVPVPVGANVHASYGSDVVNYSAEGQMVVQDSTGSDQNSGIVEFRAPPNATPELKAQVQIYVDGYNAALKAGRLSKTGRVSTKGALRDQASDAAKKEARRARKAGTPYKGHVSHVPDTTWTGTPEPYCWEDFDPIVNTSLGGQSRRYPIGYKPTGFVFKEDEEWTD